MTMRGRQHRRQDERETAGAGREVYADLTGRFPLANNGSEYLLVALRKETRFGFVKALANKRGETIKVAMVEIQLCCVVFVASTVMKNESLWAHLTTG